jgi:hypothetical protein
MPTLRPVFIVSSLFYKSLYPLPRGSASAPNLLVGQFPDILLIVPTLSLRHLIQIQQGLQITTLWTAGRTIKIGPQ